ncbi:MAG TPA: class I SAM-dependent methyltransferase [Candidatus Deferrimicrobiaceae bacterium]
MIVTRNATRILNWILDHLLPPVLRDSRAFMSLPMRLLCGPKARAFMEFKERAPSLDAEAFSAAYDFFSDCHLDRPTCLTPELTARILGDVVGSRVLDAGCGRGYLCERLAALPGVSATGIDIAVPGTGETGDNPSYVSGSIEALPFSDGSFDTVVCAHALEHVLDLHGAIRELRRVARSRLIVVVPRQRPYRYTFDLHLHFFPYAFSLRQAMGRADSLCEAVGQDLYYLEEELP